MNLDCYNYRRAPTSKEYEFYSEGPRGRIHKVVKFQAIPNRSRFYNLCFGDWNQEAKRIDDKAVTNNGDAEKVLATVAAIVVDFTNLFEDAKVYAEGTLERNRRYQMGINKLWNEIDQMFNVYGHTNGTWESFQKNSNYDAFLVTRKQLVTLEEPKECYMTSSSKNDNKKTQRGPLVTTVDKLFDVDLSKDPVVIKKTEAARKRLEQSPFPEEFLNKPR